MFILFYSFWTLAVSRAIGLIGYRLAWNKNRNQWLWFANCFLGGLILLIAVACSSYLDCDEDAGTKEKDIFGWVGLLFAIILNIAVFFVLY